MVTHVHVCWIYKTKLTLQKHTGKSKVVKNLRLAFCLLIDNHHFFIFTWPYNQSPSWVHVCVRIYKMAWRLRGCYETQECLTGEEGQLWDIKMRRSIKMIDTTLWYLLNKLVMTWSVSVENLSLSLWGRNKHLNPDAHLVKRLCIKFICCWSQLYNHYDKLLSWWVNFEYWILNNQELHVYWTKL